MVCSVRRRFPVDESSALPGHHLRIAEHPHDRYERIRTNRRVGRIPPDARQRNNGGRSANSSIVARQQRLRHPYDYGEKGGLSILRAYRAVWERPKRGGAPEYITS